jgi:cyclic dehypoxanthinyl futalosine synthase
VIEPIIEKSLRGQRITPEEAIALYERADFLTLGALADATRRRLHPDGVDTYIIYRNINYTNA